MESKRGKQPKISTSGLLDVSVRVEQEGLGVNGTRKRKGRASASRKVSVGEAEAGGDLGKKKRMGRGK